MHAHLSVSTFEPTDVPNELATSFAPMPNASTNATMKPTITIHSWSEAISTIVATGGTGRGGGGVGEGGTQTRGDDQRSIVAGRAATSRFAGFVVGDGGSAVGR